MNVTFPNVQGAFVDPNRGTLMQSWWHFLRDIWGSLGWNKDQKVFDTVYIGANQLEADVGDTSLVAVDTNTKAPQLRDANTDGRQGCLALPYNFFDGKAVTPFVDWAPQTTASGNVVLRLSYSIDSVGDVPSETVESLASAAPGVAQQITRLSFTEISGSGLAKADLFQFQIARVGGDGDDTLAAGAVLRGFGFKIRVRGIGQET